MKNFELDMEKATRRALKKGHTADQLLKKLFDAFRHDQPILRRIYEIHESLVRPPKTIDEALYSVDSVPQPTDDAR